MRATRTLDDPWPIVDAIWCANQAAPYAGRFDEVRERLDQGRVPVIERGLEMAATELVKAQAAKAALRGGLGRVHG